MYVLLPESAAVLPSSSSESVASYYTALDLLLPLPLWFLDLIWRSSSISSLIASKLSFMHSGHFCLPDRQFLWNWCEHWKITIGVTPTLMTIEFLHRLQMVLPLIFLFLLLPGSLLLTRRLFGSRAYPRLCTKEKRIS